MKKTILFGALTLLLSINCMAQNSQSGKQFTKRVKQIFEYDNTQNWTALRNLFADTMKMYSLSGDVIINNRDDLMGYFKENYSKFPKEHSTIEKMIIIGNKAIFKEKITGHNTKSPLYDVGILEFKQNIVTRIWIVPDN